MYYTHMNEMRRPAAMRLGGLIMMAGKTVVAQLHEALDEVNLSGPKLFALRYLDQAEKAMRITDLAGCIGSGKSNVTQLVDRLESDGFVQRARDPDDRRGVTVELTRRGRRHYQDGKKIVEQAEEEIMSIFTSVERAQFEAYLRRLIEDSPEN